MGAERGGDRHSPVLDPIITMNAEGTIQSASDSVEQVFGWTPTELYGLNVKVLVPEPRRSALDKYLDRYRRADKTRNLQRTRRFDAVRKDGKSIQIELSVSRADLPMHGTPYFVGIVRDVSHQVDVSAGTVVERSRLQDLITEQTRALATANLRLLLADRMASLGTLTAGLGHDMNNVLLPVRARLNAIEHAGMSGAAHTHLTAVRRSLAYLQQLSDGLHFLAIDPDGPGTAAYASGVTDLSGWWRQVGVLLRKSLPRHVTMDASLSASLPAVKIAPHWLTQAVLNLIVNAGEAIPEGRRAARVRIWAKVSDDGRAVRLGVTDNGVGMTPEVRKRALDLFFTTKVRAMGTGLGLPLARKVAVRAGGDLEIESKLGRGTTVVLLLPASAEKVAKNSRVVGRSRRATVSVRDPRTLALISQIITSAGVGVSGVHNDGPGTSDLWVTEPTGNSLTAAASWRKRSDGRALVLLGVPPKSARAKWAALGATVIEAPEDFEAIRYALGQAIEQTAVEVRNTGRAPRSTKERP